MLSRGSIVALSVVLLLSLSFSAEATARDEAAPLPFQEQVPAGYYEWNPIVTAATTNWLSISVDSNTSISTALMTSSQFIAFNDSDADLSSSLYLQNATTAQHTIEVPLGTYYLVFYAPSSNANVSYNFVEYPNSPYELASITAPEPTGIASFGLYNNSGVVTPYSVETNEVVGVADFSSLEAYNGTAPLDNASKDDAGIQLNTILVVNETSGNQQVYWLQNTPTFDTNTSLTAPLVAYGDNVWNFSVSGYLSNTTLTSSVPSEGYVSTYVQDGITQYYYSEEGSNMTYAMPLRMALMVNETVEPGTGVLVQMGTQIFGNGTATATPADWFDNVTIHDTTVQSAYLEVNGNATTPNGLFYDTEFVLGGEDNGESTTFTSLGATLGLFYDNSTSGLLTSFPSYYSFGQDTAEGAQNLQVSFSGDGYTQISVGTPNYVYLGTSSGAFTLGEAASFASATSTSSTQTGSSSSSTSSTSSSTPTSSSSTSTTSSSSSTSSSTSLEPAYLLLASAATAVILASAVWLRPLTPRPQKRGKTGD